MKAITRMLVCLFWISTVLCLEFASGQQLARIPRIGYLSGTGSATDQGPYVEALRQGLRDLRHVEGRTFKIEYRGAEGKLDRIPDLVKDLIQSKVDVLVAPIPSAIRTAKEANTAIPVVMITGNDPVANGWIVSFARPGGNITGVFTLSQELNAKRLELLTEVVPRVSQIGVLWTPQDRAANTNFKEYEATARAFNVQLQSLEVSRDQPDIEGAFLAATKGRSSAILTITTAALFLKQRLIADLAIKHRLPTMFQGITWVESGGLMSYSTHEFDAFRRAATYVDKILKGARPADLPVEQSSKYELVINLKTAKQIGLTMPQIVLARADRIIK